MSTTTKGQWSSNGGVGTTRTWPHLAEAPGHPATSVTRACQHHYHPSHEAAATYSWKSWGGPWGREAHLPSSVLGGRTRPRCVKLPKNVPLGQSTSATWRSTNMAGEHATSRPQQWIPCTPPRTNADLHGHPCSCRPSGEV